MPRPYELCRAKVFEYTLHGMSVFEPSQHPQPLSILRVGKRTLKLSENLHKSSWGASA